MRHILLAATLALLTPTMAQTLAASHAPNDDHNHPTVQTTAAMDGDKLHALDSALRDLWIGHVFWVRNVVTARLAGDANAESTAEQQVVANAKAIAGAFEPYYGAAAKEKLFGLLAGHYGAVKDYLGASVAKDTSGQSAATDKLLANAKEIAGFLHAANPNLPFDAVEGLLQAHGGHHIAQIQELQRKDFAAEAKTWGDMTQHMYAIADALGAAVAKQFPDKFAAR